MLRCCLLCLVVRQRNDPSAAQQAVASHHQQRPAQLSHQEISASTTKAAKMRSQDLVPILRAWLRVQGIVSSGPQKNELSTQTYRQSAWLPFPKIPSKQLARHAFWHSCQLPMQSYLMHPSPEPEETPPLCCRSGGCICCLGGRHPGFRLPKQDIA